MRGEKGETHQSLLFRHLGENLLLVREVVGDSRVLGFICYTLPSAQEHSKRETRTYCSSK